MLADKRINIIVVGCAEFFEVSPVKIWMKSKTGVKGKLGDARCLAMYLVREKLKMKLEDIAQVFNRHHTTVMYACERGAQLVSDSEHAKTAYEEISKRIEKCQQA